MERRVIIVECLVDQHQVVCYRDGSADLGLLFQPVLQVSQCLQVLRVLETVRVIAFNDNIKVIGAAQLFVDDIKSLADIRVGVKIGNGLGADMNPCYAGKGEQGDYSEGDEYLAPVVQVEQCNPVNEVVKNCCRNVSFRLRSMRPDCDPEPLTGPGVKVIDSAVI